MDGRITRVGLLRGQTVTDKDTVNQMDRHRTGKAVAHAHTHMDRSHQAQGIKLTTPHKELVNEHVGHRQGCAGAAAQSDSGVVDPSGRTRMWHMPEKR